MSKLVFASGIVRRSLNYLFCRDGGLELISVSDNMVMEVVSALSAVSGREVAGNWMRMVYTESPSPLQSVENITFKKELVFGWTVFVLSRLAKSFEVRTSRWWVPHELASTHFLSRPADCLCSCSDDPGIRCCCSISGLLHSPTCCSEWPIREKYSGHVICSDQYEASTSLTCIIVKLIPLSNLWLQSLW